MIGQIGGREMGGVCVGEMCMGHESWKCVRIVGIVNNGFQLLEGIRFGLRGEDVWGVGWLTTKGMTPPQTPHLHEFQQFHYKGICWWASFEPSFLV